MSSFHAAKCQKLYITKNYNVLPLHTDQWSNIRTIFSADLQSARKSLNTAPFILPRYILIFLDKDLITNTELYDYGVSRTIEDTLTWLLNNIDQTIETRKEHLPGKDQVPYQQLLNLTWCGFPC